MMNQWPSPETLLDMKFVPNGRLEARAAQNKLPAAYNLKVPTSAGVFAVSATAFGVAMVFFPRVREREVSAKLRRYDMSLDSWGKQRAIQAGLELKDYMIGETKNFTVPVDLSFVTSFQRDIFGALTSIPAGETITYGELARLAGHPNKARAVGTAMRNNPAPIFIPCHRVLPASGGIGGWSGPKGWKEWLLEHEGVHIQ
ncbi:MAG: methylated-DNA--[protein]-cysteine S-methyltransferase [Proteobacteria bacterium]|nr:methylated-DNA--[protein]-cysteine S-methyltransferase [Pseudomonadota bacterium]